MEQDPSPPRPGRLAALAEAPVAVAIVAVNVAVMAWVSWRFGDFAEPSLQTLIAAGALERSLVWSGQWWRLLTAVFLHNGPLHLLANSLFGFAWCRMVERLLGHGRFLAVYLLAGVGASAVSLLAHDVPSAGASGALFGIIGSTLAIHRRLLPGWRAFLRSRLTLSVLGQLGVWTVLALLIPLPLDHAAHGGGLVTGALVTWLMTRPAPRSASAWLPAAAAFGLLLAAAAWPRPGLTAYARGEAVQAAWDAGQEALRNDDGAGLSRALQQLDGLGVRSDDVEYLRAVEAYVGADLARATSVVQRILREPQSRRLHEKAAFLLAQAGIRYLSGEGVAQDGARGYALIKEACEAGLAAACESERVIRTGEPAPPADAR